MPHSIAVDSRDRIYVADRSNNRVQIFDKDGTFLNQWTNVGVPWGLFIKGDLLYLVDGSDNNCLLVMSLKDGKVLDKIDGPQQSDGGRGRFERRDLCRRSERHERQEVHQDQVLTFPALEWAL